MEFDDDPTDVDGNALVGPDTEKHRSLDYLAGRESGFSEGVERVLDTLNLELAKIGVDPRERARTVNRVRMGALERG